MLTTPVKILLIALLAVVAISITGCQNQSPTPTLTSSPQPTSTKTSTATKTNTPTQTQTRTLANTITPIPSNTATLTPTPYRTLSPTPSPTRIQPQPALLFPYEDVNGRTIDWSYTYVTEIGYDRLGEVNNLWAFVGFQLLDRGIHQRNFNFLGETITVYYLNVAHEFDGKMIPMQLVLGGAPGANINIKDIPAGGNAFVSVQFKNTADPFSPITTHRETKRDYEMQESDNPLMMLNDFKALLPTLPDEVILLADHPILFPRDDWPQIKLDMQRVSYLAARYQPFFHIDDYDRLADQSDLAYALRNYLLNGKPLPEGYYAYSSQTLVIILGE